MTTGSRVPSPVAVVGIGCRLPGEANTPEAFWRILADGDDVVGPMRWNRFDVDRFLNPESESRARIAAAEGGFLSDIDHFDAAFFGISPREAKKIDPQHRLLLQVAWEAMEDGGIVPSSLAGPRTGVFVGVWSGEYENVIYRDPDALDFHSVTGGGRYSASGRLSWAFDLRGPCVTVDSGCSASLAAVHAACTAIAVGEVDAALVGAANLILQPHISIAYSRSGMLSPGGRCRFGDANASGYVRSDGVAGVVLKSLEKAIEDGDRIRGVILGTMVNADGRASGHLATPSADAQRELLEAVYRRSGVDPALVPYVEAHGTGTKAGDPAELSALGAVLGKSRPPGHPLLVGSVKTNIGHTEATAGLAGLIKTLLSLEHGWIPASLHQDEPNPAIPWGELSIAVPSEGRAWPAGERRIAGVSSFGITGTNAHAIVSAFEPGQIAAPRDAVDGPRVVALSADSVEALQRRASDLRESLQAGAPSLEDLSYTTTCRREHLTHRFAAVVDSIAELEDVLADVASEEAGGRSIEGVASSHSTPRVAFVFSGQGSQWVGMGRELRSSCPHFDAVITEADRALSSMVDWSLDSVLAGDHPMDSIDVIQPVLAVVQMALARQLMAWGVEPDAVLGHSMGEVPAAHVAGALSLQDALTVLVVRSRLLAEIAGQGAMALVDEEASRVEARIERFEGAVSVAALNGPRSTVVSGDPSAVDRLLAELEAEGTFCRRVRVDVASHSAQTDPLLPRLAAELSGIQPMTSTTPFHSTVLGELVEGERLGPEYWTSNLRNPVRLLRTVTGLVEDGIDLFVEIAPHPVLLTSLADIAADSGERPTLVSVARREEPETRRFLEGVSRLHVAGCPVEWTDVAPGGGRPVSLPPYPWAREAHWIDHWEDWSGDGQSVGLVTPARPGIVEDVSYVVEWRSIEPAPGALPEGSWLVVGDPEGLGSALVDELNGAGADARLLATEAGLSDLVGGGGEPLAGVVHLGSLDPRQGGDAIGFEDALRRSYGGAAETITALLRAAATPSARVLLVTEGVHGPGLRLPDLASVAQAGVWGLLRTSAPEHPELRIAAVDLDPAAEQGIRVQHILDVLRDSTGENQFAFSAEGAHVARLVRADGGALATAATWRSDCTYLVTGGLGDLGLLAAEEMVRGGARRLVLSGRTPIPERGEWSSLSPDSPLSAKLAAVRRLEHQGASVHLVSMDVGNEAQVAGFLDRFRAEGWPSIRGVVHCAGTMTPRDISWEGFVEIGVGKAVGAHILHRLLPDLDEMVLFSSIASVLPQSNANYSAANAILDALARAREAAGLPTTSISWGVWEGAGIAKDESVARYVRLLEGSGVLSFEPSEATALFRWAAAASVPHIVLSKVRWDQAEGRLSGRPGASLYVDLFGSEEGASESGGTRAELMALPEVKRLHAMSAHVRRIVATVLQLPPQSVTPTVPFGKQGLDSLMALELRNRLELELDLRLPASLAWNYPTVGGLSEHLLQVLTIDGPTPPPASVDSTSPSAAPDREPSAEVGLPAEGERSSVGDVVEELSRQSDEEVLRALRGGD